GAEARSLRLFPVWSDVELSAVPDPGLAERVAQKRKSSPSHSSNGHSPPETSPSPVKKKKKPGLVNSNNKEQSELRHGPFYVKPQLTTDPVDVVPQDGRNDFYCWVCHREGQVLCCELCPRVYHAKCLKLATEPEGDWFCPECERITVAECIETQSKAMTMLTIDQLSYLLKFALQKMKQPGTEPFQKPVSLEQHPDYAEYIFHPMDLCTLEKNIKKKMYGCTEAFLADIKWILHNCIIYNGGNHKLTATAKVIVKICEHEMNEIEVCPECYLSACQKRENWFCEPCSQPHPLVWAKLKGFPFWPAKALREKDGQVDARFFGQHDRAWVPINNCYLMSKEIPFSVKKTKSIFNSAMQEMEVYVENIRKKFGVFNYAPFRTPYTPNNQFQMLLDPSNPAAGTVKLEKPDKIKFSFDMTASPKMLLSKSMLSGGTSRRISMTEMPRSPMSTNSSVHTGSDIEPDASDKSFKVTSSHYSAGEESMDCTETSASAKTVHTGSTTGSPKPFSPQASTPVIPKQERSGPTGSILNLNLDRSKAEMDLKELSETVQQQSTPVVLTSPKRQIKCRFQLNLDKTIESCKAQLGIDEISEDVYKGVEHSDSEDSEKSDSSDSEYVSEEEQRMKNGSEDIHKESTEKEPKKRPRELLQDDDKEGNVDSAVDPAAKLASVKSPTEDKSGSDAHKDCLEKPKELQHPAKVEEEAKPHTAEADVDSDSERELVIDLGDDKAGREHKRIKKEPAMVTTTKAPPSSGSSSSSPSVKDPTQSPITIPLNVVSFAATPASTLLPNTAAAAGSTTPVAATAAATTVKKQRPLLPRETAPAVQRAVVWNPTNNTQGGSTSAALATGNSAASSSLAGDFQISTTSADMAADIAKYTSKIMDAIKGTMTEIYNDLSKSTSGNTIAEIRRLRIEIEKLQWLHQQELSEMKHNLELTMAEMRQSLEQERERLVAEVRKQMELERQQAVDETKKKQWCANCKKEAIFYCCWNTSYCDYPCQQAHWPEHMKSCTQSATASQQEPEAESSTEANKAPGLPAGTQPSPPQCMAASVDKGSTVEKSKDNVSVSVS
uniref:Zinc finger MYND-type containing 8 n=1 Tax=Scleropages formosus TaxID=113540 RepID=A0A8C9T2H8_SCLFO